MADKNSWEPLVQISERLFPNISPQIVPGAHHAKTVLQAIQSGLKNYESRIPAQSAQVHCKWCGRAVYSDLSEGAEVIMERILTWHFDWSKKLLKIKGAQFSCQECHLLLDLKRLLNFLLLLDESTDSTKLYTLAAHFCQINGHTSQSGEDDVKLLQQAISLVHSLHVLTKNVPELAIQGPSDENITLESVNELVESISTQMPGSVQNSTPKAKRKKKKDASLTENANITPQLHSLTTTKAKSTTKKKKKKRIVDSVTNGHCNGADHEGADKNDNENSSSEEPTKKHLVLSEKRKKGPDGKTRAHGKKRRSLPVMKLD